MNYGDPTLRDHLAAEYALGTLRGAARRRFERLMAGDPALRSLVAEWETKLNPLAEGVPPVEPPPEIWTRIAARLEAAGTAAPAQREAERPPVSRPARRQRTLYDILFGRPATPVPTVATAGLWYCIQFWRLVGLGGALTAAALAVYLALGPARPPFQPSHVALLAGEDARPMLVAQLDAATGRLELTPVRLPAAAPDLVLELWLVPPGGAAPRSLGLVQAGLTVRDLPTGDVTALLQGALAVSLEPAGGSPTGAPTGPIVYLGPVLPIS